MLTRIQQLTPLVANQIAAGEVIERPASIVKECVENSIDAGSTRIEINLLKGGKSSIKITDNGVGVHPDDLVLAVSRHATSKIRSAEDLIGVKSLGFRGEALASIAAISDFTLISNTGEQAWQIRVSGEAQAPVVKPAAHPEGTTILVNELFFNTPVRRKFLASDRTEYQHIELLVKRMALSHFDIGFRLLHENKEIFNLVPAVTVVARVQRLAKLCGKNFVEQSLPIDHVAEGLQLSGWILPAEFSRAYSDLQYFFLNGRIIRDKVIQHALRTATAGMIPEGRHAAYVLYLECDPKTVDVNVHPTKHEVRFDHNRLIHDFVNSAVKKALVSEAILVPELAEARVEYGAVDIESRSFDFFKTKQVNLNLGRPIAQIKDHYLLLENERGLLILNLIQVKEFLYVQEFANKTLVAQALLLPVTINLSEKFLAQLNILPLNDWGIETQQISATQLLVKALPTILTKCDLQNLFLILAEAKDPIKCLAQAAAAIPSSLSRTEMKNFCENLEAEILPAALYQQIDL